MKRLCVILLFFGMIISVAFLGGCTKTNTGNTNQTSDNSSSTTPTPPTPPKDNDETIVVDESLYPRDYDGNGGPPRFGFMIDFAQSNIYDKVRNVVVHFSGWPTECNLLNETTGKKYVGVIDNNSLSCLFTDVQFAEGINNLKVTGKDALGTKALTRLEIAYSPNIKIDEFIFSEDTVYIDEPEDVLVTAVIPEGLHYQDKLELQVYDNASKSYKPAKFFLNDEGKNGDVTVKDGIFSFTFNSKDFGYSEGTYRFRAMIEISGVKNYTQAFEFRMGPAGVTEAIDTARKSSEIIDRFIREGAHLSIAEFENYLVKRIPEINKLPGVTSVYNEPNYGIFIDYEVGSTSIYYDHFFDELGRNILMQEEMIPEKKLESLLKINPETVSINTDQSNVIGNKKILCLSPFKDIFGKFDDTDVNGSCNILKTNGYNVTIKTNNKVTVETFKNLHKYGVIIISSHGYNKRISTTGELVHEISTQERKTDSSDKSYKKYLEKGLLGERKTYLKDNQSTTYYTIRPKFFFEYSKKYPNSIIILNTCFGMKTDTMWEYLQFYGVGAIIGYNDIVFSDYTQRIAATFIEEMIKERNIKRSMDKTWKTHSRFDPTPKDKGGVNGESVYRGNNSLRLVDVASKYRCEDDNLQGYCNTTYHNNFSHPRAISDPSPKLDSQPSLPAILSFPTKGNAFLRMVTTVGHYRYDDQLSLKLYVRDTASTIAFDYAYFVDTLCENDFAGWREDQLHGDPKTGEYAPPPPCSPYAVDALVSAYLEDEDGKRHNIFTQPIDQTLINAYPSIQHFLEVKYYDGVRPDRLFTRTTGLQNVRYGISQFRGQIVTLKIQFGDKIEYGKTFTIEHTKHPNNKGRIDGLPKLQNGMYLDNFSIK